MYDFKARLSSSVGLSGNLAIVVCRTFQAAFPNSALDELSAQFFNSRLERGGSYFRVAFSNLAAVAVPFNISSPNIIGS